MPARNSIKLYVENGYYHLYNRGVEKRLIFSDEKDYGVFLHYLKEYLLPKDEESLRKRLAESEISSKERAEIIKLLRLNNFAQEISLIAYCLMPNHYHFLIKQKSPYSIDGFMQSLGTRYTMYFNQKYKRVGSLFQAVYKACLVTSNDQFLYLTKYIHKQALASKGETFRDFRDFRDQPSSYKDYIGKRSTPWIHTAEILSHFSKTIPTLSYESFVNESEDLSFIHKLILDN